MEIKILVIEDETILRNNIKILLEMNGYEVYEADNGIKGIAMAESLRPDLIICDVLMPKKDGYEVIKELQESSPTSLIPFIFLTAKVEPADIRKGMNLGADDYLLKPFDEKDLLAAVSTRLQKHQKKIKTESAESESSVLSEQEGLILTINKKPVFVKVGQINVIKAASQYSEVYLADGSKCTIRKSLATWENQLPPATFMRVHRSTIINTHNIIKLENWFKRSLRVHLQYYPQPIDISSHYANKLKSKV